MKEKVLKIMKIIFRLSYIPYVILILCIVYSKFCELSGSGDLISAVIIVAALIPISALCLVYQILFNIIEFLMKYLKKKNDKKDLEETIVSDK